MSILYVDVSSNNHDSNGPLDWNWVKSQGVTGVWVKATEGTGYTNPFFIADVEQAHAAGLQVGAYQFAHPGSDVTAQWNYFSAVVAQVAGLLTLRSTLDIEVTDGVERVARQQVPIKPSKDTVSQGTIQAWVNEWHALSQNNTLTYTYRAYLSNINNFGSGLWLAWPGWNGEGLPGGTVAVQTGQISNWDIETILNIAAVSTTVIPQPIQGDPMGSNTGIVTLTAGPDKGTDIVAQLFPGNGQVWLKDRSGNEAFNQNGNFLLPGSAIPGTLEVSLSPDGTQARVLYQLQPTGQVRFVACGGRNLDGSLAYGINDMN